MSEDRRVSVYGNPEADDRNLKQLAGAANVLTAFLGVRDIPALTRECLRDLYDLDQADVMILFGGSIPYGCDVAAGAWKSGLAKHFMIVGGIGHTTQSLRDKFNSRYPEMETEGRPEAEMMAEYLSQEYDIHDVLLERESTNCGNNVTYALRKLKEAGIAAGSILILQEPSMQRRMAAGFQKELGEASGIRIISYAPYLPQLTAEHGDLCFCEDYWGLWDVRHYVTLLLGDVSRLRDDEKGYGPRGAGFLPHVDIPAEVEAAFRILEESGMGRVREANPAYGGK